MNNYNNIAFLLFLFIKIKLVKIILDTIFYYNYLNIYIKNYSNKLLNFDVCN